MGRVYEYIKKISLKESLPFLLIGLLVAVLEILGEFLDILQAVNLGTPGYSLNLKTVLILGAKGFGWWLLFSFLLFLGWRGGMKLYSGEPSNRHFFQNRFVNFCPYWCFHIDAQAKNEE